MSPHAAWRGERRIRVAVEIRPRSVRVSGMWLLDGPAVQRPALDGTHVAQITVGGATMLLQSFDDPLLVRGIAAPADAGHSYARLDRAIVHIDVPIPAGALPGEIAIRIVDLSQLRGRPTDPAGVQQLLDASPQAMRPVAYVTAAQLVQHPDWATLGLPGAPADLPSGSFEIYVDQAGKYRWRLRRPDGQIVADSGQGYGNRADCEADLRWIREHATSVPIRSLDIE